SGTRHLGRGRRVLPARDRARSQLRGRALQPRVALVQPRSPRRGAPAFRADGRGRAAARRGPPESRHTVRGRRRGRARAVALPPGARERPALPGHPREHRVDLREARTAAHRARALAALPAARARGQLVARGTPAAGVPLTATARLRLAVRRPTLESASSARSALYSA